MCDLIPEGRKSPTEHPEPLKSYYESTAAELAARLGPLRARIHKVNLTVFPTAFFTTSSNMIHIQSGRPRPRCGSTSSSTRRRRPG
jgi:hypothetical protein